MTGSPFHKGERKKSELQKVTVARRGTATDKLDDLRKQAEKKVRMQGENVGKMSASEINSMVHDLRVHHVELEMQNEELKRSQQEVAELHTDVVMKDAWKEARAGEPQRDMLFTVKDLPAGYGDPMLIKQVCINIISNAVKFTKYREPANIEAGGYVDGNECVYYIRDNGAGFDMAYYDKLFGVFQRLHSMEHFEGTGVGLATVQRIIQRHGGRVWAEGKVDEGACFYFTLNMKE